MTEGRDDDRPDPDALLVRIEEDKARAARGRLKIFFGASPGVGKTFAMLAEGQRLRKEGRDVVVGVVETHGRADTQRLLEGLDTLPVARIEIGWRATVQAGRRRAVVERLKSHGPAIRGLRRSVQAPRAPWPSFRRCSESAGRE